MALNPTIPKPISDQIKLRQRKLNLDYGASDIDIIYRNNRYPFIRLTSGINIDSSVVHSLGLNGLVTSGNDLAKKYKLFSTRFQTKNSNDTFTEDFASNVGYSFATPTSYGFTSNPTFGYTPPPGISDVNIKTLNKGGVRTAEINLIAHNIFQFNIINALYLKLRYCMLLEWGHNVYYDNDRNYINNNIDLSKSFLNSSTSLLDVLTAIEQKQIESCGNYDALVGVVKNFTWNMTPEGSYQIKIELISAGDIAESIQINSALSFTADPEKSIGITDTQWLNPITYNRSSLDRMLKRIQAETSWQGSLSGDSNLSTENLATKTGIKYSFKKTGGNLTDNNETYSIPFSNLEMDSNNVPVGQYYIKLGALLRIIESFLLEYDTSSSPSNPSIFLDYDYDNNFCFALANQLSSDPTVCLIPLALDNASKFDKKYIQYKSKAVFEWNEGETLDSNGNRNPGQWKFKKWSNYEAITTDVIPTGAALDQILWSNPDTGEKEALNGKPVNFFEAGTATKNKYFPLSNGLPPNDPNRVGGTIYEIGNDRDLGGRSITYIIENPSNVALKDNGILSSLDNRFRTSDVFKGKLMHILINMNFIHKTIEDNIDSDGKITLSNFLTSLLDGIQGALGYINDFTLSYNHANNSLRILDNTYLTNLYNKIDPSVININTVTPEEGSFVLDYSMKSEVFSKQGNALLAGSQTNGNTGVSNGTIFAELYKGTTDRVLTTKQNKNTPQGSGGASTELSFMFERYKQYRLKLIQSSAGGTSYSLSKEDISSFKDSIKDYYRFEMGQFTKKNNIKGDRLIPLNLQLTVDGLSGLDIHQVFAINTLALPSDYVGEVGFVIRELTHKVSSEGWKTDIGSLSILKKSTVPVNDIDIIESIGTNTSTLTQFEDVIIEEEVVDEEEEVVVVTATKCDGNVIAEVGPATGVYIAAGKAPKDDGTYFVDVSKTVNSSSLKKLAALNGCTYPIKFYTKPGDSSGTIYSKVVGFIGKRNSYEPNPDFNKYLVSWSYTGKTGFTKSAKVNKTWNETLTQIAQSLDGAGLWNDNSIKGWSPGIVYRDVTPSSGIEYGQISAHAFGMAIDINSGQYPLGSGGVAAWDKDFADGKDTAKVHNHINNNFVKVQNGKEKVFWLKDTGDAHHFSVYIKV
jgi:hypothetical protein